MKMELVLPKLREEMQEAVLCSWVKSVGDKVEKGEPVESPFSGTLKEVYFEEGDEVKVEEVVGLIEEE